MKLIDIIKQNVNLTFVDISTNRTIKINELNLHEKILDSDQKKLAFLYLDNSLNSIEIFLAFMNSKHTLAMMSLQLNSDYKTQLEELYKPAFIFDPNRNQIDNYNINYLGTTSVFFSIYTETYYIHPELKIMLSTSGTTGSPKFVKLSEKNLIENALSICDYLPISQNDQTPLNLPIFYSYGLSVLTTNAIQGGTIYCNVKDVLNREFWNDFKKYQFTSLAGVPYLYEVLNRIGFTKKAYPSLRYLTQAGGKLNIKLVEIFSNYCDTNNLLFFIMYGATEATARMSFLSPDELKNKPASIGKAIKNGEFSIDVETKELLYKGPNVYGGYAVVPTDLSSYDQPELIHTGDIAEADKDGFYYITGRLKRFVKIFGMRVNLDEIEALLKTAFNGQTFICVGSNDKNIIVITNTVETNKDEVLLFIHTKIGIHISFIKFYILENIPLTQNGKIDYNKITMMYATE